MNETIITWNVPNWITIVIMAALGFAVIGGIAHLLSGKAPENASN
jgi:hypothetical protein